MENKKEGILALLGLYQRLENECSQPERDEELITLIKDNIDRLWEILGDETCLATHQLHTANQLYDFNDVALTCAEIGYASTSDGWNDPRVIKVRNARAAWGEKINKLREMLGLDEPTIPEDFGNRSTDKDNDDLPF